MEEVYDNEFYVVVLENAEGNSQVEFVHLRFGETMHHYVERVHPGCVVDQIYTRTYTR